MFMMQPHRRSNRRPRNNKTTREETKIQVQAFIEANHVESKEEDDLPIIAEGFEYDKEMYLANDRYASMIEKALAKFIEDKIWNEAQKIYTDDDVAHKDKFAECKTRD